MLLLLEAMNFVYTRIIPLEISHFRGLLYHSVGSVN